MTFADLFAALRWWFILLLLGAAVLPAMFVVFRRLPDRGYAFIKMAGLLLVGFVFWLAGSLGFLGNNGGGIIFAVAIVAGLSYWLYRRERARAATVDEGKPEYLWEWLGQNRTQVLLTEIIFAVLFFLWVWVRAQNPAISATEKPMEFAFLNAIGRSPTFPPLDPWLSGYAISYYYFGYVMTSLLARLALVSESIAFNLAIAWLVAGAGTGAFGLVYNLLRLQGAQRSARLLGIVAALALPLAGNLTVGLEIAHGNGYGSPTFWQWLDVRDLNEAPQPDAPPRYEGSSWWWWRSSRPIHEYHLSGQPEEGLEPIAEFPAFSFVLGDLHPHVLALPFAFLSLAVALAWWLPRRKMQGEESAPQESVWWREIWGVMRAIIHDRGLILWLFTALLLGGLAFLNTWDVLIYLFVILGAFALAGWRDQGWSTRLLGETILAGVLLLFAAVLLYLPFFLGFRSQAGAPYLLPMLMRPTRLVQFLIIFGMPLLAVTIFLLALVFRQRFRYWQSGVAAMFALIALLLMLALLFGLLVAANAEGAGRVTALASELGISLPERPDQFLAIGWALSAIAGIAPYYFGARLSYPALTLFLAAMAGMVVMVWREKLGPAAGSSAPRKQEMAGDVLPFTLLLIATGVLLTIGPEFLFLRDNFGVRLNTIFKFYYQAWVLFGIGALYAIGYLWLVWQGSGRLVPALATAGYALLFLVALFFPYYAIQSRAVEYRGPAAAADRLPATLDGLAQMSRFNPGDYGAVQWLRENVAGTPVVLEAVGGQYTAYGRVSASTGLPTLLGWAGHEYQWRGDTPEPAVREPVVSEIYSSPDMQSVAPLLNQYSVAFIIVGNLEREAYGPNGLDKFGEQLTPAFSADGVSIYRWQPEVNR
ncbi:MAG: DUF2298 domain-containing protein [Candidatus Promineifilaceae bacterium]